MIITDTYRENADNFKRVVGNHFGYSTSSFETMCKYIDDPTLILNDNAKKIFEEFGDRVVDFRVPIDAKKIVESDIPSEIYPVKFLLSNFIYDNYQKEYTEGKTCVLSDEIMINNKFMLFGEERKLWKFLHSNAEFIARRLLIDYPAVSFDTRYTTYKIGAVFRGIDDYLNELEDKETLLKTKILKLKEDFTRKTSDVKKVTRLIQTAIRITADIINAKNIPNYKGYEAYLSFNYFDWFLASSGESWDSCLSLDSETFYAIALPNLISCPDWAMVEIVKKNMKEVLGIKVPHVVSRTWAIYGSNDRYNIIKGYPIEFDGLEELSFESEYIKFQQIRSNKSVTSKNIYKPFVLKDDYSVPMIYADAFNFIAKGNFIEIILDGNYGLVNIGKKNGYYSIGEGYFYDMCEVAKCNYDSIGYLTYHCGLSFFDVYENSETIICDQCGNRDSDCEYIEGFGNVCQHCIDYSGEFYYCYSCESLCSVSSDSYEIVNNMSVCQHCINEYYSYCYGCGEYYLNEEISCVDGTDYCEMCIDERLRDGTFVVCKNCEEVFTSLDDEIFCERCAYIKNKEILEKTIQKEAKNEKNSV